MHCDLFLNVFFIRASGASFFVLRARAGGAHAGFYMKTCRKFQKAAFLKP